ncbi:MAG: helix-turn-helix transcriptional regulator [Halanaerobiales bacterium]|nr:helix-turn-helix transcriptional regulator [Halanaerobiales bacterium]
MKKLSSSKLADTIKLKRKEKKLTQKQLSDLTGINRIMIGRIEREEYIPSINQFESLAGALDFNITDMFVEKQETNSFVALQSEALSKSEKDGVEKLFTMMLTLRQQIVLRSKADEKTKR